METASEIQPTAARLDGVVVGIDGSGGSLHALDWAIQNWHPHAAIHPVLSYQVNILGIEPPGLYRSIADIFRDDARACLLSALQGRDDVVDEARLVRGSAGPGLVEVSRQADLLVVGSRGRSSISESLLGSVGSYCVKHAKCPVAVIPPHAETGSVMNRVVVGVDGSANSMAALQWAADNVAPGGTIQAVACWEPTLLDVPLSDDQLESSAESILSAAVDHLNSASGPKRDSDHSSGPDIEQVVHRGDARHVLGQLGSEADALVMGARGHRGVPHLLLGSVATSLLHHPVTVSVVVPCVDDAGNKK